MRRVLAPIAAALALAAPTAALAAHGYPSIPGLYGNSPVPPPVLANVTVPFGQLTQKGDGGVRLASVDNSSMAFAFKGLDLWNGAVAQRPVSWTIQDTTSTSGYTAGSHWSVNGGSSCMGSGTVTLAGPDAITPVPCAAGVTAGLNKGPYTFRITATDVAGAASGAKTLTYTMVSCAITLGEYPAGTPNTSNSVFPASFTSAGSLVACPTTFGQAAGSLITIPVGLDEAAYDGQIRIGPGSGLLNFTLTAGVPNVTVKYADAARPAGIWTLFFQNISGFTVGGMTSTTGDGGAQNSANGGKDALYFNNVGQSCSAPCVFVNNESVQVSPTCPAIGQTAGLTLVATQWLTTNNLVIHGSYSPVDDFKAFPLSAVDNNITFNNTSIRYYANNAFFFTACANCTLNDTRLIAPMRCDSIHVDSGQLQDVTTTTNLIVHRIAVVQADGTASAQGFPFEDRSGDVVGWIDDGSAGPAASSGKAGTVLHDASIGPDGMNMQFAGAPIIGWFPGAPSTNVIAAGTATTTACANPVSGTTECNVSVSQLVGSPSAPVTVMSAPISGTCIDGLFYAGADFNGATSRSEAGTSCLKHFTLVKDNGYLNGQGSFAHTVFAGQVTSVSGHPLLTIAGTATGTPGIYVSASLADWPWPCNPTPTWQSAYSTNTCALTAPEQVAAGSGKGANFGLTLTGPAQAGFSGTYLLASGSPSTSAGTSFAAFLPTDQPVSGGPWYVLKSADRPLQHQGTMTVASGFLEDSFFVQDDTQNTSTSLNFPANWSISHVHEGCLNGFIVTPPNYSSGCSAPGTSTSGSPTLAHNALVAAFAACAGQSGGCDLKVYTAAEPPSHWAGLTDEQVVAEYVGLVTPKTSGSLDNGDGTFDGAFLQNGKWNDGSGVTP